MSTVITMADFKERMAHQGFETTGSTPEQFRDYIMAETLASELVRADVVEAGTDVDLDGVTARIAIAVATRD